MEFVIRDMQESVNSLMRRLGYRPAYFQKAGESSIVRPLGGKDYPRFHLYIKQRNVDIYFNLHLDQKKPSYEGFTAHSGDYDGDVVRTEMERIKGLLQE